MQLFSGCDSVGERDGLQVHRFKSQRRFFAHGCLAWMLPGSLAVYREMKTRHQHSQGHTPEQSMQRERPSCPQCPRSTPTISKLQHDRRVASFSLAGHYSRCSTTFHLLALGELSAALPALSYQVLEPSSSRHIFRSPEPQRSSLI